MKPITPPSPAPAPLARARGDPCGRIIHADTRDVVGRYDKERTHVMLTSQSCRFCKRREDQVIGPLMHDAVHHDIYATCFLD
jgi:hypothetical protein